MTSNELEQAKRDIEAAAERLAALPDFRVSAPMALLKRELTRG